MTLRVLLIASEAEQILFLQEVLLEIEQARLLPEWPCIDAFFAASWAEAQRLLATSAPHAILLDLAADGGTPFRLARAAAPDTPVILLVEPGDESLAAQAIRDGAEDFLLKPQVDCAPLAHALRNAVLRRRLLSAARAGSLTDSLTGLPNRIGFLAVAERDRKLAEKLARRWMLLVLAPRELPWISPASAEQRRDLVLMNTAERLRAMATPADLIARIDERHFAMTIFETGPESAEATWALLRARAAEQGIDAGVFILDPGFEAENSRGLSLDSMLERAVAGLSQSRQPPLSGATASV